MRPRLMCVDLDVAESLQHVAHMDAGFRHCVSADVQWNALGVLVLVLIVRVLFFILFSYTDA